MPEHEEWEQPFRAAREAVRVGDFDEVKDSLALLGFKFKQGNDPNHWTYYHPELRNDPIFRYPCNLYRPHGTRRSSDRIGRHDQSKAKQMIEALREIRGTPRVEEDSKNESEKNRNE